MTDRTTYFELDMKPDAAHAPDDAVARLSDALDDYASLHAEDAAGLGL